MTGAARRKMATGAAATVTVLAVCAAAVIGEVDTIRTVVRGRETTVTLREGWSMLDHAAALDAAGVVPAAEFLASCRDVGLLGEFGIPAADAEGFLFPDTYWFFVPTPAAAVVRRLIGTFRARVDPAIASRRAAFDRLGRALGADPLVVLVTVASIVEAETPVPAERPLVASVAWNRLTGRDPSVRGLQMDPTVSYGCRRLPSLPSCAGWDGGEPTRAMLADASNPYNTYRSDGLPPGPIGNPGLASILAVLEAKQTPYMYFVARGDGTHEFSRTYQEHARAVRKWRRRE